MIFSPLLPTPKKNQGGQLEFGSFDLPSSAGDGQGQCPRTSPPQDGSDKVTFFFGFLSFFFFFCIDCGLFGRPNGDCVRRLRVKSGEFLEKGGRRKQGLRCKIEKVGER